MANRQTYKAACEKEIQAIARTRFIEGIFDVMDSKLDAAIVEGLSPNTFVRQCLKIADSK